MFFKRMAGVLALVLGVAGMAGCLTGAYGLWLVQSRLERANDKLFNTVDQSLKVVQDRVPLVQQKVKEAKVTSTEVKDLLREWGARKAQERLVAKLQIENRAEKLSEQLRTADLKLEASQEAVRDIRKVLEVGQELGAGVDPTAMDTMQERLESLREMLQQAERAVEGVSKFAEGDPVEDRLAQVAKVLARILLTLSEVDRRLDDFAARLSEVRGQALQANARISHAIVLVCVVCYGLLAWVGAGQAALSWWGWQCFRRRRLPAGQPAE